MAKFSLTDLLNSKSKAETTPADNFKIELISVHKLIPSKENFYSVEDIADLKDSIEIFGIQQNLVVKPIIGSDEYKVIAGHRRRLVTLQLIEEGKGQFELVPCKIESNEDDVRNEILLIHINSTIRNFSEWERVTQIDRLKELFKEYKKNHDLPGRVRELLAETLNVSVSQVGRIESINDNLTDEFKEELKHDNINFSTAAELSRLSVADQKAVYEQHKETGSTTLKAVKEKKAASIPQPVTPESPKVRINELQELLNSLVSIRAQYDSLMDNPIGEKTLKSLSELTSSLYDHIEFVKEGLLGQPLFDAGNQGGM